MSRQDEPPDEAWQLVMLLVLHPEHLSVDELRRDMLADRRDFASVGAHDRAVRDLVACLRRHGRDSAVPRVLRFASRPSATSIAGPIIEAGETVAALQVHGVEVDEAAILLVARTAREFSDNLAVARS